MKYSYIMRFLLPIAIAIILLFVGCDKFLPGEFKEAEEFNASPLDSKGSTFLSSLYEIGIIDTTISTTFTTSDTAVDTTTTTTITTTGDFTVDTDITITRDTTFNNDNTINTIRRTIQSINVLDTLYMVMSSVTNSITTAFNLVFDERTSTSRLLEGVDEKDVHDTLKAVYDSLSARADTLTDDMVPMLDSLTDLSSTKLNTLITDTTLLVTYPSLKSYALYEHKQSGKVYFFISWDLTTTNIDAYIDINIIGSSAEFVTPLSTGISEEAAAGCTEIVEVVERGSIVQRPFSVIRTRHSYDLEEGIYLVRFVVSEPVGESFRLVILQ